MGALLTDDLDLMHELGVCHHAANTSWGPGRPLLCWNRLKAAESSLTRTGSIGRRWDGTATSYGSTWT